MPTRQYIQLWKRSTQGSDHLLRSLKVVYRNNDQARLAYAQTLQDIGLPRIPVEYSPVRTTFSLHEAGIEIDSNVRNVAQFVLRYACFPLLRGA